MQNVTECLCGCGEPALYAERHVKNSLRSSNRLRKWEARDMGYTTPCHLWKGRVSTSRNRRYATIYQAGRYQKVHRVLWEVAYGPIPDGFQIHHRCEITYCVNLDHLSLLTARDHVRLEKGKLSPRAVRYIRVSSKTGIELARELGVSASLISQVRQGQVWADVP